MVDNETKPLSSKPSETAVTGSCVGGKIQLISGGIKGNGVMLYSKKTAL